MTNIKDKLLPPQSKSKYATRANSINAMKANGKLTPRRQIQKYKTKDDDIIDINKSKRLSPREKNLRNSTILNKSPRLKNGNIKLNHPINNKVNNSDPNTKNSTIDKPDKTKTIKNESAKITKDVDKPKNDKPRPHKCDQCGKAFLGKNDLNKHSLIHSGIKPHRCEYCGKEFRQAGNLKTHVIATHSNVIENPSVYICDHCNKMFLVKERLRLHLRTHMGVKPYSCKNCSMKFGQASHLRHHQRTHTGERNFLCSQCDATFSSAAKLKLHLKSHYNIRDYTCYLCGKSFTRPDVYKKHITCFHNNEKHFQCHICKKTLKGHLQVHLRTHEAVKPHGCAECGSRFAQRSQLTVHQRTHSGARPYRCRVCWLAFAHTTALKMHTRRHTGEKPYTCRICSGAFTQLSHMKKHMQIKHGENRPYCHRPCGGFFSTKIELEDHINKCVTKEEKVDENGDNMSPEELLSKRVADAYLPVDPPMALTKMRLLLAVLLKKISSNKRLDELGFNKRLIDDILIDSLESSGHTPCKDNTLTPAEKLKQNVQMLLEWTVPPHFMKKFQNEQRSTEELLEELTS